MISRLVSRAALCLLALFLIAGCGGGDSTGTISDTGGGPASTVAQQTLVMQMDLDGDDEPDLLTLDISRRPFRIVEALRGVTAGDPVDFSDVWRGREIDSSICDALSDYLADSFGLGRRTELDVRDRLGETRRVVVFE